MDVDPQKLQQARIGIERLSGLLRAQSWAANDAPALHPAQRSLLLALAGQANGLRSGDLAARLGVSAPTISDSLRTLEGKGLVQRKPDPHDGRAWRMSLTRAGKTLARRLQDPAAGLGPLLQALPERELGQLLRVVQLMMREAQQRGLASGLRTCLGCEFFRPYASTDPKQPHFCAYVGAPFGDAALRVDCAEHKPQSEEALAIAVQRFRDAGPS